MAWGKNLYYGKLFETLFQFLEHLIFKETFIQMKGLAFRNRKIKEPVKTIHK